MDKDRILLDLENLVDTFLKFKSEIAKWTNLEEANSSCGKEFQEMFANVAFKKSWEDNKHLFVPTGSAPTGSIAEAVQVSNCLHFGSRRNLFGNWHFNYSVPLVTCGYCKRTIAFGLVTDSHFDLHFVQCTRQFDHFNLTLI